LLLKERTECIDIVQLRCPMEGRMFEWLNGKIYAVTYQAKDELDLISSAQVAPGPKDSLNVEPRED
jgi:hypothetical protein